MLIAEIAQYLDDRGFGVFDETGVTGSIFLERLPEGNGRSEVVIALVNTGGYSPSAKLHLDRPTVQVLIRGGVNPTSAHEMTLAIYNCLQSYTSQQCGSFVADGTWIIDCQAVSSPGANYRDDNGRIVYPLNFILSVPNPDSEWRQ